MSSGHDSISVLPFYPFEQMYINMYPEMNQESVETSKFTKTALSPSLGLSINTPVLGIYASRFSVLLSFVNALNP